MHPFLPTPSALLELEELWSGDDSDEDYVPSEGDTEDEFDVLAELNQPPTAEPSANGDLEDMDISESANDHDPFLVLRCAGEKMVPNYSTSSVVTGTKGTSRRGRKRSRDPTKLQSPPTQIPRLILPDTPGVRTGYFTLSLEQQQRLKTQLAEHFQLLVQVLVLGYEQGRSEVVTNTWELVQELRQRHAAAMAYKTHCDAAANGFSLPSVAIMDIPGIACVDKLSHLLRERSNATAAMEVRPQGALLDEVERVFQGYFKDELKVAPELKSGKRNRLQFTPAEDQLLARGLARFGLQWEAIQAYYLPSKTVAQLIHRYKNMSSKRATDNPIKQYKQAKEAPLTPHEEALLLQGVRLYGRQWDLIAKWLLPHRIPSCLALAWPNVEKKAILAWLPARPVSAGRFRTGEAAPASSPAVELPLPLPPVDCSPSTPSVNEHFLFDQPAPLAAAVAQRHEAQWTKDEDRALLLAVKAHGATSTTWAMLAHSPTLPRRSGEAIQARYTQLRELMRRQQAARS